MIKKVIAVVISNCFIYLSLLSSCFGAKAIIKYDINCYDCYLDEMDSYVRFSYKCFRLFMPELDKTNISSYETYYADTYYQSIQTINLIRTYDEAEYQKEKDNLIQTTNFLTHIIDYENTDYVEIAEFECTYKGYKITIVDQGQSDRIFARSYGMIGFNDEQRKICWIYYYKDANNIIRSLSEDLEYYVAFDSTDVFGESAD